MRSLVTRHVGGHVVVAAHGNLVALMLNDLDSAFGYEFWRRLSFPDVYRLTFDADALISVEHMWEQTA